MRRAGQHRTRRRAGGSARRRSAAAPATRRSRAASRSQKIAPKLMTGRAAGPDRHRLGEQHRALAVVAASRVDQLRPGRTWGCRTGSARARRSSPATAPARSSASKHVSREPFCLYIGNSTRCSIPSLPRGSSGRNASSERVKSGLPKPPPPRPGDRRPPRSGSRRGAGSAASSCSIADAIARDVPRSRVGVARRRRATRRAPGAGRARSSRRAAATQALGSAVARGGGRAVRPRPPRPSKHRFCHSVRWSSSSMQSSPNRSESASTTTLPARASWPRSAARPGPTPWRGFAPARRAPLLELIVVARYRQAALTRASRSPPARGHPTLQVGKHPARAPRCVLVVLDGVVLELQPEAREQLVEVVAVLLLLGLAEHDQAAAARTRTPRSRRARRRSAAASPVPVVRSQAGRTDARSRARRRRRASPRSAAASALDVDDEVALGRARRPRARTRRRRDARAASGARARDGSSTPRCGPRRRRRGRAFRTRSCRRGYPAPPAVVDAEIDVLAARNRRTVGA